MPADKFIKAIVGEGDPVEFELETQGGAKHKFKKLKISDIANAPGGTLDEGLKFYDGKDEYIYIPIGMWELGDINRPEAKKSYKFQFKSSSELQYKGGDLAIITKTPEKYGN